MPLFPLNVRFSAILTTLATMARKGSNRVARHTIEDEILAAEIVLSEDEIFAEFEEQCWKAAENCTVSSPELREVARAFCRMKERRL
jgi:hypothetical protein